MPNSGAPFKQKGWEAYTKVKDKPIKPSTTETGDVRWKHSRAYKNAMSNPKASVKEKAKALLREEFRLGLITKQEYDQEINQ